MKMTVDNIAKKGHLLFTQVPDTKTKIDLSVIVSNNKFINYRKYAALRLQNVETRRFFLNYQKKVYQTTS